MRDIYETTLIMPAEDARELERLFHDFTADCARHGLWIRADTHVERMDDGHDFHLSLVIDDDLKRRPGPRSGVGADDVVYMMSQGMSAEQAADALGVSRATVYRKLAEAESREAVRHVY